VPLIAEGELWNNMAAIIMSGATLLAVLLNWVTNMFTAWLSHRAQLGIKADVKENTDLTKAVLPAVEQKTGSAVKAAENAQHTAEKITETAAAKVGVLIGKALSDKAERAADKVADVALKSSAALSEKIDTISKNVKGEDGTCLTGKVNEHGEQIKSLVTRMEAVEGAVSLVKGDTKQILDILASFPVGT